MRMSTDTQRTTSKGKAITPKYAARMNGTRDQSTNNIYATVDSNGDIQILDADWKGRCPKLVEAEEKAYKEEYEATVMQVNAGYKKTGNKDRIKYKTATDYLKDPDLCPYRINFSIGDIDEHATLEEVEKASMELIRYIKDEFKHIRVISYALHADGKGGRGDVHIGYIPIADKYTRSGQLMTGDDGEPLKEFKINKALAQDGQEKYFKDADKIIKSVNDPDIKDIRLTKNPKFCNEQIGFTQKIRQHMFDWCEKELGLELEREPDERRSRDPYEQRQKANTRLSTADYIELDNARKEAQKVRDEAFEYLEQAKAELNAEFDDEGLARRTLKLIEKHGSPKLIEKVNEFKAKQQQRDANSAKALKEFFNREAEVLQAPKAPDAGPQI